VPETLQVENCGQIISAFAGVAAINLTVHRGVVDGLRAVITELHARLKFDTYIPAHNAFIA